MTRVLAIDQGTNLSRSIQIDGQLRLDGQLTAAAMLQFLSDRFAAPVDRPLVTETTAPGAISLAGLRAGLIPPPDQSQQNGALARRFNPAVDVRPRHAKYARWGRAVAAAMAA